MGAHSAVREAQETVERLVRAAPGTRVPISQNQRTETPGNGRLRSPKSAIAVWLFQLVFPTLVLIPVLSRFGGQRAPGIYTLSLLGFVVAWYAGCFLALGVVRPRRWILTHPAQLIVLYVSSTLGLVIVEMFCRYQAQRVWSDRRSIASSQVGYSRELGWKLIRGEDGVGEHGWRGPNRTAAKPKGTFRIVCVGDSTTHGYSCPWHEAWPHQLETLLNADSDWRTGHGVTEVVNLGVPGFGTDQELLALKKEGLAFQPDVVILHMSVNDFSEVIDHGGPLCGFVTRHKPFFVLEGGRLVLKRDFAPLPTHPSGKVYQPGDELSLGLHPVLLHEVEHFLDDGDTGHSPNESRWPIRPECHAEYDRVRHLVWSLVREMADTAGKAGSRLLVTFSPALMNAPTDVPPFRVGSFLQEYEADATAIGVPAIHFVDEYFAEGGRSRFVSTDPYHLNGAGNALVARHTMQWLKKTIPATR
jgi:lysophospholipase L1-like esterase